MSIASELQDKINAKAAIKAAIEAKGVTVGDVKLNQYAAKVDAITQDPTIPVGTGQHLVTFYDFNGKVLKRQMVNTGEDATAPAIPTHQYLTFAEWNNPFKNVQSDIDTGAIYNTTDGKTYLFITLTQVTGLAPTLYFSKSSTSLMTIDWGDGTTSTSTTSGNQSINHVYSTAGDYIITVDNSGGGTWSAGQGTGATKLINGYEDILTKLYIGNNIGSILQSSSYASSKSLNYISFGDKFNTTYGNVFIDCSKLKFAVLPSMTGLGSYTFSNCNMLSNVVIKGNYPVIPLGLFYYCYNLKKAIISVNITSIGQLFAYYCYGLEYIVVLPTSPPALVTSTFTISKICKIYVPDASVDAYKAATNWVTYANYIYPLSEKPQSDE